MWQAPRGGGDARASTGQFVVWEFVGLVEGRSDSSLGPGFVLSWGDPCLVQVVAEAA